MQTQRKNFILLCQTYELTVVWNYISKKWTNTQESIGQSTAPNPRETTVCPKKYAHGFCFAVLCCGYTLTDFPISIRLTSLALWQSNDCPSAGKATRMNLDKYFMWIHYERLHNHNKAKHNKTVCIFLGIYCISCNIWNALAIYPSWEYKFDIKESDGNMFNPIV